MQQIIKHVKLLKQIAQYIAVKLSLGCNVFALLICAHKICLGSILMFPLCTNI